MNSISDLEFENVGCLITAVAEIADAGLDLLECRTELLTRLLGMVDSKGAMWTWGVSDETAATIAPVASIAVGYTDEEKTAVIKMGLDPTMHEEFRIPIMQQMQGQSPNKPFGPEAPRIPIVEQMQGRSQITSLRTDLYDDHQWKATKMHANLAAGGCNEWLHSLRYGNSETWSSLWLMRRTGSPAFQPADRQLIDVAMGNIPWLGATLDNSLPVESCVALTSSQRVVLMMQLDGLSRKEIAGRLHITVDTVGDHIKKIYEHFDVNSTGELSALFLRNR